LDFHVGSLSATASTNGIKSFFFNLWIDSGYLHGKLTNEHGNHCKTQAICSPVHLIGVNWHLVRFVGNPEAPAKNSRIAQASLMSLASDDKKMIESSVYNDMQCLIAGARSEENKPFWSAHRNNPFNASITKTDMNFGCHSA
jgi:hypothetical protein